MMLRLHRLWSEPRCFEPITFGSGINLIVGDKSDAEQQQGRAAVAFRVTLAIGL